MESLPKNNNSAPNVPASISSSEPQPSSPLPTTNASAAVFAEDDQNKDSSNDDISSEEWLKVLTKKERRRRNQLLKTEKSNPKNNSKEKSYAQVNVQPNNEYNPTKNNGERPFLKNKNQSTSSYPLPAPPPTQNSWDRPRVQQVFVYQDSNGKHNENNVFDASP